MKTVFTFCLFCAALTMNAQQSLVGTWNMGKDNTKIEITQEKGVYGGKIVASDNAKAKIGSQLLKDIKSVGGQWKGKMYSPKKGKWFDAILKPDGAQLFVTVKAGLVSRTLEWKKE